MLESGWTEELASGSADLDLQHRAFFDALVAYRAEPATREGTLKFLAFLADHARDHFRLEESYMAVYRYPARDAHRAAHRAISTRLQVLRARLRSEALSEELAREVADLVDVWLRDQIAHHDRPLITFLKQATGQGTPADTAPREPA